MRTGFAVLVKMAASGLLVVLCLIQTGPQDVIVVPTKSGKTKCGLVGMATSGNGKQLNRKKNRYEAPTDDQIDPEVTLAAMLAPGDDLDRFDETKAARLIGFVIDVKVGGVETCNCGTKDAAFRDTHIELGLSPHAPNRQRVIVEVTPRLRIQKNDQGVDWRTNTLRDDSQNKIKGKWVEVTGWLTFDTMHVDGAENSNPGGDGNWRATCWELHPVTDMRVLDAPPPDLPQLQPAVLSTFHRVQARQLNRDPQKKQAIEARNKALLAKFDPSERDEEMPKQ